MSLPRHQRTKKGNFRRARGDERAGNLARDYPEFRAFRADTHLGTIRDRLGATSIDAIRAKIRRLKQGRRLSSG